MKHLITFLFCLFSLFAEAQVNNNDTLKYFKSFDYGWSYKRLQARDAFILPTDTVANKLGVAVLNNQLFLGNGTKWTLSSGGGGSTTNLIDSLKRSKDSVYARKNGTFYYQYKDSVGTARFTNNIILNGSSTNRLGVWVNGDTIPVAGMALDSAFKVITQKAVAPTYYPPTVSISSSPSATTYEIGSNLGTVTLSNSFTQNDAGAFQTTTYYKDNVAIGGNSVSISNLINQTNFKVSKTYLQGPCKNNNLGVQDCTGRIQAGTVTSSYIYFTPMPNYYFGYSSTALPSSSTIVAREGGGYSFSYGSSIGNTVITVTGTNKYVYYAYPASYGTLSSIIVSGLESIGAFNLDVVSVTNSQGYVQNYNVYTSQNYFNNTTVTIQSAY